MTTFKIIAATTDGTNITLSAKGCVLKGMRTDEYGNKIQIIACRGISVVIAIADLPPTEKWAYIKQQIENAYDALPNETLIKSLIDKQWNA